MWDDVRDLMKAIVWNFILFVALAFAISSLTGCGGTANTSVNNLTATANANRAETPSNSTPEVAQEKTPSEYPALKPDIAQAELTAMDGSTFKIADKKGKVILINLWATWCGPCLSEMPSFVKMQETYGPQGFEILGLDTDDESDTLKADINKVIKEKNINYPIVFSDTQTQAALLNISKFDGIPQSFLIDADGNLHGVFKGANKENVVKIEEIVSGLVSQNKSGE
jgi:thiol-disulfide isomerase/thioredoxin